MPQSGFIRRGAGFGAEKNEDGAAECRQKVLLIGGSIINRRAESAPLDLYLPKIGGANTPPATPSSTGHGMHHNKEYCTRPRQNRDLKICKIKIATKNCLNQTGFHV